MSRPLRVLIVGGGPAGLYLATLLKRRRPDAAVEVIERNPRDATFGFGVVFSDRALDFLRADDPETFHAVTPRMETWGAIELVHRGTSIPIDGIGFSAIGRLELLKLLQAGAAAVGVEPRYEVELAQAPLAGEHDLVVAADGVNSLVRGAGDFGTTVEELHNRFAWFGTQRPFDALTQTFVDGPHGRFNAHHYRYTPDRSTFIAECDAATFAGAGLDRMDEDQSKAFCEEVFAEALEGRPLVSNRSAWRRFPKLRNARWFVGNTVLIGDALRTAHFSIGSGTRLALEDAIALDKAMAETGDDVAAALPAFEAARRPVVDKITGAADRSAAWYEDFAAHMDLAPWDFAWSYIQRTGRVDPERLRRVAPAFVAGYEASRGSAAEAAP